MLPESWTSVTIGDLCDFSSGTGFSEKDWAPAGLPIIRIQNLSGARQFNYSGGNADPRWIVEQGELLFAWAGVPGVSFGPTIWEGPRGVLNQHIDRIVPRNAVDEKWLHAALQFVTISIKKIARVQIQSFARSQERYHRTQDRCCAFLKSSSRRRPGLDVVPFAHRDAFQRRNRSSRSVLPPLRGSSMHHAFDPWADAHGYLLPSLRD